jgi:hypothetical protein
MHVEVDPTRSAISCEALSEMTPELVIGIVAHPLE